MLFAPCVFCRRALSDGATTWLLYTSTCKAAARSWSTCRTSRIGSSRETGVIAWLTRRASAWSMRWESSITHAEWLLLVKVPVCDFIGAKATLNWALARFIFAQKFKANGLLAHEQEVNQLQEEGDNLIKMKHPGSPTIKVHFTSVINHPTVPYGCMVVALIKHDRWCRCQAHRDTVQAEWQAFLNLCLAQEVHLDNIDNYKKVKSCEEN